MVAAAVATTPAAAQDPPATTEVEAPAEPADEYQFDGVAPKRIGSERSYVMELNFRARVVSIPRSILDTWFFDADDPGWAYVEGRPRVIGYVGGIEYVVKNRNANGIFYVQFIDSNVKPGYWDDSDEDRLDGDFLDPSPGLGLIAYGANYAYEAHIIETTLTQGQLGLSFLAGGGLGMGIMAGKLDRWGPDAVGNPSYKRFLDGEEPDTDKRISRVYPLVDINAGFRVNFGDRLVMRIEGGLHTMLYYGATAGVPF